ncbi:MAG: leucine-rich repeat protein, partial [Lachnospiraceae bacterium]|nr:leucine-rich repeat protein [Lachnospiraceae bacterium]
LYLNGEFWGLYNMTEKYSDKYLAEEFDVDKDNVIVYKDLVIDEGAALDPEGSELKGLMELGGLDMTKPENYNKFLETVDVDSYIDYYATEIYINNNDWWSGCSTSSPNNLMFWKVADSTVENPDNPYADGKWRYMLFDTEWSMGIYNSWQAGTEYDSIKYHAIGEPDPNYDVDAGRTEPNGDPVFRAVFKNAEFRKKFTNTFLDLRNWNFESVRCDTELDRLADLYLPLLNKNMERWNVGDMYEGLSKMKRFLNERPDYVLTMLEDNIDELDISDRVNVTVTNSAKKQYAVGVNTILPDSSKGFRGVYYKDYPITVSAKDMEGYQFERWEVTGGIVSDENSSEAVVTLTDSRARINAVYTGGDGTGGDDADNNLEIGTYYVSEFAIPFAEQKNAGDSVGFEVQVNDCGDRVRYGTLNLFAKSSPYDSGEEFGRLILSDNDGGGIIDARSLKVKKTSSGISVDGVIDDAWEEAEYVTLNNYQGLTQSDYYVLPDDEEKNCSAKAKFLWDDNMLYVLVVTDDEDIVYNYNGYESDSVEIFYDEDAVNPVEYTDDMFQFRLLHNGINENGRGNPEAYHVQSGVKIYDGEEKNGYIAEFVVPFKEMKNTGDKVSLELQVADSISETYKRIGKLNLFAYGSPFSDRSQFGLITLCDNYAGNGVGAGMSELYAVRTDTAITVDGVMEDAWRKASPVVIRKYTSKDIDGMVYEQSVAATARIMWDSSNLYVLVKVIDNDLKRNESISESDCVELFFDESVDEDTLASTEYNTAFQYRILYDGTEEAGNNYLNAGYSVVAASSITKTADPSPMPTDVPAATPSPLPSPSPSPVPTETPEAFTASFVTNDATVTTYLRQNYDEAFETFVNQKTAYARSSDTGDIDTSGNGQVNFTVVPKDGYCVDSVSVFPKENYKNIKPPAETGKDNTYRVTKITGDITITVKTKPIGQSGDNKDAFTAVFDAAPNCSITTYDTQDYTNTALTHVNQTRAVARDSLTGEPDVTGNGQINFTVVPDAGYAVKEVVVTPDNYKNLKMPGETGKADTYRITKIIGNITVKVTVEKIGGTVTPPPTVTDRPDNTDAPDITEEPGATEKPDVTKNPDTTEEPGATQKPDVTKNPDTTKEPQATERPQVTGAPAPGDSRHTANPYDGTVSTDKEFTYRNLRYIISGRTAIVKGAVKKTVTAVHIPASVKWGGITYKVSQVSDGAFKNCKRLKKVTIGKNVSILGKDSFRGCKKLTKIVVKSVVLKKTGKSAFLKTSKNIKLYVPKNRYVKYSKKLFQGKGLAGSAKYYKTRKGN